MFLLYKQLSKLYSLMSKVVSQKEQIMDCSETIKELKVVMANMQEELTHKRMSDISEEGRSPTDMRAMFEEQLFEAKQFYLGELEDEITQRQMLERKLETLRREKECSAFPVDKEVQTNFEWVVSL